MIQEVKESDYTIASAIYTAIYFACTYGAVCIGHFIGCTIFNIQYDFIATIVVWLVCNSLVFARNTYYRTKDELKEHVKENGGVL